MSKELENMSEEEMLNTIKLDSLQSIIEQEGDRDIISPCCITTADVDDVESVMEKVRAAAWQYFQDEISCSWNWDVEQFLDADDMGKTFLQLTELLDDKNGFDEEFMYYDSAMNYLKEEDPTLEEALEAADDYGLRPKDLNSCTLAGLLAMSRNKEEWNKKETEIDDLAKLVKAIESGVIKYFTKKS